MEPYQDKAWDILTQNERNSLFLQMSQGQSSWEAGEILNIPHYKYLELKERSIKFFKMFSDYFMEFNTLVNPNSVVDDKFRDYVEGIIEKRLTREEALKYTGDSALSLKELSDRVITKNMSRLLESELKHDNRLYDLIIEFDRWNNRRVLPRELQLPSAYKRRNNKRDKTYIDFICNIPENKTNAIINLFTYKPRKSNKKVYYISLISDQFEDGYYIVPIKPNKTTIDKISKLSIYIFDDKDKADTFGFMISKFKEDKKTPQVGQKFWPRYRDFIKMSVNYDIIKPSDFYNEKLDMAYGLNTRRKRKKKADYKPSEGAAKRVNPEFFYSKK